MSPKTAFLKLQVSVILTRSLPPLDVWLLQCLLSNRLQVMKSILKLTSCHQKCPICWIIFLSENPPYIFIPSSTTPLLTPPQGQRNCQGAKLQDEGGVVARHLEIKSAMDPWKVSRPNDKLCLGGVSRPSQDSISNQIVDSEKVETVFLVGGEYYFLGKSTKKRPWKLFCFSLFCIKKKWSKFRQDDLRSLDYQRLPSSPKSHSLMHRDAVVSRFSSVALKPWGTVQSAFFLEVHSISILDTLHLHKWS